MAYSVQRLQEADLEIFKGVLAVFSNVFEEVENGSEEFPADAYLQARLQDSSVYIFAALDGEEVLGGLSGYILPMLGTETKELYLYDLAVASAHRMQGVASALVSALKAEAKQDGVSAIFVDAEMVDEGAVAFYQSLGATQAEVANFTIVP